MLGSERWTSRAGHVPRWVPVNPATGQALAGFASVSRGRFWHRGECADLAAWLASAGLALRGSDTARYERGRDGSFAPVPAGEPPLVRDRFGGLTGLRFSRATETGIRNNSMVGAEVGRPGQLPDHWFHSNRESGLQISVAGTGTEGGVPYADIRWHGTVRKTGVIITFFESPGFVPAEDGQAITGSCFIRLAGGSLANTSSHYIRVDGRMNEREAVDAAICDYVPDKGPLEAGRISVTAEMRNAAVRSTSLSQRFQLGPVGSAVDLTLRIGAPLLHAGHSPGPLLLSAGEPVQTPGDYLVFGPGAAPLGSPDRGGIFGIRYAMHSKGGGDIALPFVVGAAEEPSLALCGPDGLGRVLAVVSGVDGRSVLRAPSPVTAGSFLTAVLGWHPDAEQGAALSVNGSRPVQASRGCAARRGETGCIGLHLDGVVDEIFFDDVRWPDTAIQALSI